MSGQNPPEQRLNIPILPLRDVVVYPHMVIPLFVGRSRSIQALDAAMQAGKQILLVAQKQADVDDPRWRMSTGSVRWPPSCNC
jgi:ATP-dependent Lon protease